MAKIHFEAGRYEALRDAGDLGGMAELDLLMCAEPGWPLAKAGARKQIDKVRDFAHAKALYA